MANPLKRLALIAVAVALCGCSNFVYSDAPLFTARDARGLPDLRPGVWAAPDDGCVFDDTTPLRAWPDCASGMTLGRSAARAVRRLTKGESLLAAGDPMILQMTGRERGSKSYYLALRAVRLDGDGRAIELASWPIQCGPPTPPDAKHPDRSPLTATPLAGLEVRDDNCVARDAGSVRAAAKASEAWTPAPGRLRWVRDGRR